MHIIVSKVGGFSSHPVRRGLVGLGPAHVRLGLAGLRPAHVRLGLEGLGPAHVRLDAHDEYCLDPVPADEDVDGVGPAQYKICIDFTIEEPRRIFFLIASLDTLKLLNIYVG